MRSCWREGEFLWAVYRAMRDDLSWDELQRISTTGVIISDRDGDYNDWVTKNGERVDKAIANRAAAKDRSASTKLTIDDYRRELAEAQTGLAEVSAVLAQHRVALAHGRGVDEGLLDPGSVETQEQVMEIHATKVDQLQAAIVELFGGADATLDSG